MEENQVKGAKKASAIVSQEIIDSFNTVLKKILKAWSLIPLQDTDSIGKLYYDAVRICANINKNYDKDNLFKLLPYLAKIPYLIAKGLHFSLTNKLERSFRNYEIANKFCNYTLNGFQKIKDTMHKEFISIFPIFGFLESCFLITKTLKKDSFNALGCKKNQVERFRNLAEQFRKFSTDLVNLGNKNEEFNEDLNNISILAKRISDMCKGNAKEIEDDKLKESLGNSAIEIQFPVGQGGLHLGVINDFAYIYDCGASNEKASWSRHFSEIRDILKKYHVKEINIYISHMHDDHCNKLISLISELANIDICLINIYIPKITPLEKLLLLLDSDIFIKTNEEFYKFVCDPINFHFPMNNQTDQIQIQVIEIDPNENNIPQETDLWILDPYVYGTNDYEKELSEFSSKIKDYKVEDFLGKLLSGDILENLFDNLENKKIYKNLAKKYREHFNPENDSKEFHKSMLCLYSGPKNHCDYYTYHFCMDCDYCQPYCCKLCRFYKRNRHFSNFFGWLHTGDINLKSEEEKASFCKHYKEYLPNKVSIMQIPHHGSNDNHDENFLDIFGEYSEEKLLYLTINDNELKRNERGEKKATKSVSDIKGLCDDNLQVITEYSRGLYFEILL